MLRASLLEMPPKKKTPSKKPWIRQRGDYFPSPSEYQTPIIMPAPTLLKLDLGSGPRPAEGFKGVDIVPGQTDYTFDLCDGQRWPFDSSSVDELRSSHFIEHIYAGYVKVIPEEDYSTKLLLQKSKRIDALLWFFDEAFRIAKPGAVFTVQWPALQNVRAFQDPTHRRFIPAETIAYLSIEGRKAMGVEHYGATCNWIGTVYPTIPTPPETPEDKLMALRADSSDEKQKWQHARNLEQQRRYVETWNYSQDLVATLRAEKGRT